MKFIVKTVYGDKFGPYESDNPFLEHRDAWGRPPREDEVAHFSSQIVKHARTSEYFHNNGQPIQKIVASPDYWIETLK